MCARQSDPRRRLILNRQFRALLAPEQSARIELSTFYSDIDAEARKCTQKENTESKFGFHINSANIDA